MLSSHGCMQTYSVCKLGEDFPTAEAIRKVPLWSDSPPSSATFSSCGPGLPWWDVARRSCSFTWAFLAPASQPRSWDTLCLLQKVVVWVNMSKTIQGAVFWLEGIFALSTRGRKETAASVTPRPAGMSLGQPGHSGRAVPGRALLSYRGHRGPALPTPACSKPYSRNLIYIYLKYLNANRLYLLT